MSIIRVFGFFLISLMSTGNLSAMSCHFALESDNLALAKTWKEFSLTNPKQSISLQSRSKLEIHYYDILIKKLDIILKFDSVEKLTQSSQFMATALNLENFLERHRLIIYTKFEISKKFRDSNPEYYRAQIAKLNDEILFLIQSSDEYIDVMINNTVFGINDSSSNPTLQ